jgi:hypothetical protein
LNDKSLAEKFASEIASAMGTVNRGAKSRESTIHKGEDYYGVIDYSQDNGIPHVFIIESGFHTNPEDEAILLNDDNLRKIAKAQAKVICEFYGIEYPAQPKEQDIAQPVAQPAPTQTPAPQPAINTNAVVVNDWLYGRDANGNIEQGRRVDIGDKIEVLDISHSKQLALVKYPTPSGLRQTYVTDGTCIKYLNEYNGQVIASKLNVRLTAGGKIIGSLAKNEKVTILGEQGDWMNVAYATDKGPHTKSGWVSATYIKRV